MVALPQAIEAQILPSPNLTVLELLQYDLPIQHPTFPFQITDFFDKNTPNETDPNIISKIPTPSREVVLSLQTHLATSIKNGNLSIKCIHSIAAAGMTYPLWIVAYWAKVGSVREIRDGEGVNVVNQIFDVLAIVRWNDKLYYASSKWLTGDHANQMLDLLRKNLQRTRRSKVEVLSTYFYFYRRIGDELSAGISDQIAFLVNLDRNHWVCNVGIHAEHLDMVDSVSLRAKCKLYD